MSYKKNTNLTTKSPGMLLYNYFKKKFKTTTYDEYYPMQEVKNFESNLENFAKNLDVIFLCYPNNNFKKL